MDGLFFSRFCFIFLLLGEITVREFFCIHRNPRPESQGCSSRGSLWLKNQELLLKRTGLDRGSKLWRDKEKWMRSIINSGCLPAFTERLGCRLRYTPHMMLTASIILYNKENRLVYCRLLFIKCSSFINTNDSIIYLSHSFTVKQWCFEIRWWCKGVKCQPLVIIFWESKLLLTYIRSIILFYAI